ncbi:MAG: hypothetical protein HYY13_07415 [Nitrospirae bacterium]|nr:hypothetical protein [Nitrospirota bacterium]
MPVAPLIALTLLSAAAGNFQPAAVLAKGQHRLGLAGQALAEEGDTDSLRFPIVDAGYNMGFGFGDFTLKLFSPVGVRAGFKLGLPAPDGLAFSVEGAASAAQAQVEGPRSGLLFISWDSTGDTPFVDQAAFSGDLVFRLDLWQLTLAPRVVSRMIRTSEDNYGQVWAGGAITRCIRQGPVQWWVEFAALWGASYGLGDFGRTYVNERFLLYAPGVGASVEF